MKKLFSQRKAHHPRAMRQQNTTVAMKNMCFGLQVPERDRWAGVWIFKDKYESRKKGRRRRDGHKDYYSKRKKSPFKYP